MKKIVPYIVFCTILMVMATLTCMAKDSFKARFKRSGGGGLIEFTNNFGRLGIASAFLSGPLSSANTSTISVVSIDRSVTNVLVKDGPNENTLAWIDEGGAVQLDRNEIIRYEWTETAVTTTATMSSFDR